MSRLTEAFERGEGFYTVGDVAFYARMHPNTVRSWFSKRGHPVFRQGTSSLDDLLSFTDLVEAIYVRKLRYYHHIQFSVIRTAIDTARQLKNVEHPFAHPDFRTVVVGKEINIIEGTNDTAVMTALAPNSGQVSNISILSDFITDLEFDKDKIIKHIAFRAPSERVIITPNFNFGAPMMESAGYPAETLWIASKTEGGIKEAASAYGVDEATVQAAVDYYGELKAA